MFKRFFYLIGINIAIIITINVLIFVIERVFGISIAPMMGNYQWLIIWAAMLWFGGALVNLMISKRSAKRMYGIQLIDGSVSDRKLQLVYRTVEEIAYNHQIKIPEVGYYDSGEVNAFATGASKDKSLVAVSTGLLEVMNDDEIQGVVWHEMAHILNGDMVTSTLLRWALNTFTIFVARVLWAVIDKTLKGNNERGGGMVYLLIVNVLDVVFGMLAGLVLMAHSRSREYKADAGSASYLSKAKMIAALKKLWNIVDNPVPDDAYATLKFGWKRAFAELWSTHPPLHKRIEHLEQLSI